MKVIMRCSRYRLDSKDDLPILKEEVAKMNEKAPSHEFYKEMIEEPPFYPCLAHLQMAVDPRTVNDYEMVINIKAEYSEPEEDNNETK
jgi:hypothetical protein